MDPVRTMWPATTRRTSGGDILGEEQRISVARAVRAMTLDSHWLVGDTHLAGSLRPGQRADLVAVDRDLSADDGDALRRAAVVATMIDGGTPVRALAWSSADRWACQKDTPSRIRIASTCR